MAGKRSKDSGDDPSDKKIPFDREKENFMGMIGDVLSGKDFSSPEEATKFLNEAFTGRTMSDSLAEWDTRPPGPLDEARDIVESIDPATSPETRRRHAKEALAITRDCMEAWEALAWTYKSPQKIEEVLLQGIAHGGELHADLIAGVEEEFGLWGYHETRPFLRLFESLAGLYEKEGRTSELISTYEEMLSLNPGDNQGIRSHLLHRYLTGNRLNDARKLLARFSDDIDIGIIYGRVLLELLEIVVGGHDFTSLARKENQGRLKSSDFGPRFKKAKSLMNAAIKANPYVPILLRHPTSLYADSPDSFQIGSPAQALVFINDHAIDWTTSMVGWLFAGVFTGQAEILIRKDRRAMRESYRDLLDFLKGIDDPPWQQVVFDNIDGKP